MKTRLILIFSLALFFACNKTGGNESSSTAKTDSKETAATQTISGERPELGSIAIDPEITFSLATTMPMLRMVTLAYGSLM